MLTKEAALLKWPAEVLATAAAPSQGCAQLLKTHPSIASLEEFWRVTTDLNFTENEKGVVRRNPRNFRQPSSSPATSASRSMNLPSVWKV